MKYEESMRIILKNSNGEEFLYELEDKESIKEIKRIVEEIKSLDESFDLSSKYCECCGNLR